MKNAALKKKDLGTNKTFGIVITYQNTHEPEQAAQAVSANFSRANCCYKLLRRARPHRDTQGDILT